ncbi:hypothetical protein ACDQ55_11505 [Chitinophaga sp. 30R24]|uniref:hypothetical protein n=1 Tax=Chitinophaga sp. 30R24 TaxID=3248838 RepID=UPI003B9116F5
MPTSVCPGQPFQLVGKTGGSLSAIAVWSQVGGPAVTIVNPRNLTTNVTGYTSGQVYKFRLSTTCTDGSLIYDEVTYNTFAATVANLGPDINVCPGNSLLLANAPGANESGLWMVVGTGNSVTFAGTDKSKSSLPINVSATQAGATQFSWTITNSNGCISSDTIKLTNGGGVTPVTAGADAALNNCFTTTQQYKLNASYGGDNTNGQQGTWSVLSGPNSPRFDNIHANTATVSNLVEGTYRLRWTVSGPCVNGTAEITLTVPAPTQSVTIATNASATYCDNRTSAIISGLAPTYSGETLTWTRTQGTGNITSPGLPVSEVTGLTPGVKSVFTYEIQNYAGCKSAGTYTINYTTPPTITAVSPIIPGCDETSVTIPFTTNGGDQTQWALISAPSGSQLGGSSGTTAFANTSSPLVLNGLTVSGTYLIRFKRTTNNGNGGCQDAYADVYVQISKKPTAANAGTKQILACSVYETHLAGNVPASGNGSWSQVAGPNNAHIADKSDPTTLIDQLTNGIYTFRWIITGNAGCPNQQSDVQVVVANATPTAAAAGSDETICNSTPYRLQGNQPALNETGTWTVTPASGITFSDTHDPHAIVTGMAANTTYTFKWEIKNACESATAMVKITTSGTAGPKQADAGPDRCLTGGTTSFTLAGNAPAARENGAWRMISGPNNPTFADAAKNNTNVSRAINGTYLLEWSLAAGGCPATLDTVMITISNPVTTAAAGADAKICGGGTLTLNGNQPVTGTGTWTQTQGPGGLSIVNPNLYNTTVTNVADGRYTFQWTISNGACASSASQVNYTISSAPTIANAGPDQTVCGGTATTLAANTISNGVGTWSIVNGPSNPTFANPVDPHTQVTGLQMGTYTLRWTAAGSLDCPVSTADMKIVVTQNAKVAIATQNLCNASTALISGNEGSTGTWTDITTPNPYPATIVPNSGNTALVKNLRAGITYKFQYALAAVGSCPATSDIATIIVSGPATGVDAGPDQSLCIMNPATDITAVFNAQVPGAGTGTWSLDTKPSGAPNPNIVAPGSPTSSITGLVPGSYIFNWNVVNGSCPAYKDVLRINVAAEPSAANAGATQPDGCSGNIILTGNAPAVGVGTWTMVSGQNTPTIDAVNANTTAVYNTVKGDYLFRWTIANGSCVAKYADVAVKVTSLPGTVANANVGGTTPAQICNTSGATGITVAMHGNAPAAGETGKWSMLSPAGSTAVFTDPTVPTTDITGLTAGTYTLQWAINSGSCQSASTIQIRVDDPPTVASTGPLQNICLYSPLTLTANTPVVGIGAWSVTGGPGTPVFSDLHAANAVVTGLQSGAYTFRWTTSNGVCAVSIADLQAKVEDCRIQVVKTASTPVMNADGTYTITFRFTVTNPGADITINNVQVVDNLSAALPAPATFSVVSLDATGPLSGKTAASFNGTSQQQLLNTTDVSLAPGATANIILTVNVKLN